MLGRSRIRGWLEQLLHTHDTPRRTAAAFALGVFLGFSPLLGLHAILGLALAFLFGLNRVAVILGVYSNLPWILPAYYTFATLAGAAMLGLDVQPRAIREVIGAIAATAWHNPREVARILTPYFWAYTVGSTIGAAILAGITYYVALAMIQAHRRHQEARHKDPPPEG
ncbi:MAG TPA: DUF2062 domain-containing protein [Gemmatimonadaceae bacterium]|nr:DUF2062 domain-containing protein [Gemmatimonadaceae bacterium]